MLLHLNLKTQWLLHWATVIVTLCHRKMSILLPAKKSVDSGTVKYFSIIYLQVNTVMDKY